ncbi:hypothetical protein FXW30_02265 [Candidatus Liberibacter asiaticus]|uniref:Uncharacterized protein n=2 Tax=Liberibacter asiaticus TaxID=34021 RepID=C6XFA1_LIBAP|nr:hypothetical protein CLIBASIA_02340 [Candidatus Liberibacter asiaticus str. psy62]AGH16981.1 hypothetical protein WSI_03055 [Candidatus Liberibacter asiaticus str. gxpsy]KAE9510041.1 hypothetical protein FXW22_03050 [Candidatus Liberibacter asiaticus]KAE9510835.1 hypothetical protein FXW31_04605 [Candidatus Liberibacter asiaticus]KAE9512208.1 hypothetical protein FXW32_03045 [Candidatus Liberibacter asiaticus]
MYGFNFCGFLPKRAGDLSMLAVENDFEWNLMLF